MKKANVVMFSLISIGLFPAWKGITMLTRFFLLLVGLSSSAIAQTVQVDSRTSMLREQFRSAGPLGAKNRKQLRSGEGWICVSAEEAILQIRGNANFSAWIKRAQNNPDLRFDVSCSENQLRASSQELGLNGSVFSKSGEFILTRKSVLNHIFLRMTPEGLLIGEFTKPATSNSRMRSIANPEEEIFNYFMCVPEGQLAAPMIKMPAQDSEGADKECAAIS